MSDTPKPRRVLLAMPTYNGTMFSGVNSSIINASRNPALQVSSCDFGGSLLPLTFNRAWTEAVCNGFDLFAMIHADVQADALWLDKLVAILDERQADLVTSVIPIKDENRWVSTGVDFNDRPHLALSYDDIARLPPVFGEAELREIYPTHIGMLHNTGLWVCRLRDKPCEYDGDRALYREGLRPWILKWRGFTAFSGIDWSCEPPRLICGPEDYTMSREIRKLDPRPLVLATSSVRTRHWGTSWWDSPRSEVA